MRRLVLSIAGRELGNGAMCSKPERAAWNDNFLLYRIRAADRQAESDYLGNYIE